MLKTDMEFSRGILFVRMKGDLNKESIRELKIKDFKFIVLNINNICSIDSYSINYLNKIYKKYNKMGKMIICDKYNITKKILKGIPKIKEEYDAYTLFERMI